MRNISKVERVNKPWFRKLWGTGWHCPPQLLPEGRRKKTYIDHPLIRFSSHPRLVSHVAGKIGRKKSSLFYAALIGRDTRGPSLGCALLLILFAWPVGLIVLLIHLLLRQRRKSASLFEREHRHYLEDIWMTALSARTLAAFRLGEAGYLTPSTIRANLYIYPTMVSLIPVMILTIHWSESQKGLHLSEWLFYAGIISLVFVVIRTMGVATRSKQSLECLRDFRNILRAQHGLARNTIENLAIGCLKMIGVVFCLVVLLIFFMMVIAMVVDSIDDKSYEIVYFWAGFLLTVIFIIRLAQPKAHRWSFYSARKKERRLLREIDALYRSVCNDLFDSSKGA